MVGMEIRDKVATYVRERIGCLRRENPGQYQNISVMRHNAMKYLPNFFRKGQLTKLFFLFPVSGCCCSTTASAACPGALAVCVQCFGSCVGLFWMGIAVNCPARTYNPGCFHKDGELTSLPKLLRWRQQLGIPGAAHHQRFLVCVQDPHFKASNHRRRIIQPALLTEYAHIMAPGGWLYTITDVPELGEWMVSGAGCWRGCMLGVEW